jgi:hypothetical protein
MSLPGGGLLPKEERRDKRMELSEESVAAAGFSPERGSGGPLV